MTWKGHGHVLKRPDGQKADCGGPATCPQCRREWARHYGHPYDPAPVPAPPPDGRTIIIPRCTRCDESHSQLPVKPLSRPFQVFTHWATCPTTGDPILLLLGAE